MYTLGQAQEIASYNLGDDEFLAVRVKDNTPLSHLRVTAIVIPEHRRGSERAPSLGATLCKDLDITSRNIARVEASSQSIKISCNLMC